MDLLLATDETLETKGVRLTVTVHKLQEKIARTWWPPKRWSLKVQLREAQIVREAIYSEIARRKV